MLVETWTEIRQNLMTLNSYRTSVDFYEREFYVDRIRLGKCFVALETDEEILFGPSRFLGYVGNNIYRHEESEVKHGWDTNPAINAILGPCKPNDEMEDAFVRFCSEWQISPANNRRKYWYVSKDRDFLSSP